MDLPRGKLPRQPSAMGRARGEAAPHTDSLFSAGKRKACLRAGCRGLCVCVCVEGGGQQAAQALGLDQGPFLGWESRVRRANVSFCPKGFLGLPSRKRQLVSSFTAPASSRQGRTGTREMPGPLVIRAGRK